MKVNVGCGWYLAPGYINVDKFMPEKTQGTGKFKEGDILYLPFDNDSADLVEAHQVLEHLSMKDVIPALVEIHRIMKIGAKILIDVPSFNGLCLEWLGMELRSSEFDPQTWHDRAEEFYGIQIHEGEYHRCPMTPNWLAYCLQQAKFSNLEFVLFPKNGRIPNHKKFGIMATSPKPFGDNTVFRHETIFVEAKK